MAELRSPDDVGPVPSVVCIPSSDHAFRTHVQVATEQLHRRSRLTADDLLAEIVKAYPDARVHRQEPLASLTSQEVVLYAYRDRSSHQSDSDEWWQDEALPATVVSNDGVYVEANVAALELFGVERERLIGSAAGAFTRHEGPHLGGPLFETLAAIGHLDSTALIVRPDGQEVAIAFHVVRDGAGVDRHRTIMRRLGD